MDSAGFECCNAVAKERLEDETGYLFVQFSRLSMTFFSVVVAVTTYWEYVGKHNQLLGCKPNRKRGSQLNIVFKVNNINYQLETTTVLLG